MIRRIEYYDDFRAYLRDFYEDKKHRHPYFSHRYFSRRAGLTSPSHFNDVVNGTRKLNAKTIGAFIKGLGLQENEARYFTLLVNFNQCADAAVKQQYLEQMRGLKRRVRQQRIPPDLYEYYSRWYNVVLRELACTLDWGEDYAILARSTVPPIKKSQARESIAFLLKAGFLTKDRDGAYCQADPAITSGPEVTSLGIREYNRTMAGLARAAVDEFPPSERDIQTVTVGISREGFRQIKQEMQEFISRVVRIVDDDKASDQVYNVNVHLFPVSRKCLKAGKDDTN